MRERNYRTEALQVLPAGCYVLSSSDQLQDSDLVYSWTTGEFYRADSDKWVRSPLEDRIEDIICAVRKADKSQFAAEVPARRVFKLTMMSAETEQAEPAQTSLF